MLVAYDELIVSTWLVQSGFKMKLSQRLNFYKRSVSVLSIFLFQLSRLNVEVSETFKLLNCGIGSSVLLHSSFLLCAYTGMNFLRWDCCTFDLS